MTPALVLVAGAPGSARAIARVLGALPRGLPAPVVVVARGLGAEDPFDALVPPRCALPVVDAEDREPLVPGHVYLAPPGYDVLVEPGHLVLAADEPDDDRPSLDALLESARAAYGDRLLAIVLEP